MNWSRMGIMLALCAISISSTGCYRAERLEQLGYEILDACPEAHFKKDISLSLGGLSWGIIKKIALAAEKNDREVRTYIRSLNKIELVVYKASGISRGNMQPIGEIVKESLGEDWELMVKTAEDDELVWIHYRGDDDQIREMNIVSYDGDEFVIVRLSGNLDDMMEMALEDHGGFTDKIVHSAR